MRIERRRTAAHVERLEGRTFFSVVTSGDIGSGPQEPTTDYPAAKLVRLESAWPNWPMHGAPGQTFGVRFSAIGGVDVATLAGEGVVAVEGPDGTVLPVAFRGTDGNAVTPTGYYHVEAPGGSWDAADNGSYRIRLAGDRVSSVDGHRAPAAQLDTFGVNVPAAARDLTIDVRDSWTPPATLRAGTRTRVPVTVTNLGNIEMGNRKAVTVDVRLVGVGDGAPDAEVGRLVLRSANLQPGQSRDASVRVTVPDWLAEGVYRYEPSFHTGYAERDNYNDVARDGPTTTVVRPPGAPAASLGRPELKVTSETTTNAARRGTSVTLTVTVQHVGGAAAKYDGRADVEVRYETRFRGTLNPGESRSHTMSVYIPFDASFDHEGNALLAVEVTSFTGRDDPDPRVYHRFHDIDVA